MTFALVPVEGIDICYCGSKYWDGENCHSCKKPFNQPAPFLGDDDFYAAIELLMEIDLQLIGLAKKEWLQTGESDSAQIATNKVNALAKLLNKWHG